MTLPESITSAINADVDAYRAKLEAEARLSVAMHRLEPTDSLSVEMLRARTCAQHAHESYVNAIVREGVGHG